MSLKEIINLESQKERYSKLSEYINKNKYGLLNKEDTKAFIELYNKYYIPDDNKPLVKVHIVELENNGWGSHSYNKHFRINKYLENDYTVSIKRLSGKESTEDEKLNKALRTVINSQIIQFRKTNKLNPNNKCPLNGGCLGVDAQVDHIKPFKELVNDFKREMNYNEIEYYYNKEKKEYDLNEPYKTEWFNYHDLFASLRYTSKQGNLTRKKTHHKI